MSIPIFFLQRLFGGLTAISNTNIHTRQHIYYPVICNVVVKGNISRRTFTKAGLASIAATASAPKSVQADDHEIPGWIGKETRQASQTAKLRLVPLVAEHSELTVPQASILDELKKIWTSKENWLSAV